MVNVGQLSHNRGPMLLPCRGFHMGRLSPGATATTSDHPVPHPIEAASGKYQEKGLNRESITIQRHVGQMKHQRIGGAFPYFRSTYEKRALLALNPKAE